MLKTFSAIPILALLFLFGCGTATPENTSPPPEPTESETTEPETTETTELLPEETSETTARTSEATGEATEAVPENPLLAALREGGYVVYLRHTETDASPMSADEDGHLANLEDCSLQRNLTEAGREDARSLGEDVERLGITVGDVLASPYCRTRESAELALGEFESVPDLATPRYLAAGDPEYEERVAYLRDVFSTPPENGANTFVFTHELNLRLASGESVPEGGAVVFEPRGETFEVLATLPPEWWGEAG